jgi:hypothetical protein
VLEGRENKHLFFDVSIVAKLYPDIEQTWSKPKRDPGPIPMLHLPPRHKLVHAVSHKDWQGDVGDYMLQIRKCSHHMLCTTSIDNYMDFSLEMYC